MYNNIRFQTEFALINLSGTIIEKLFWPPFHGAGGASVRRRRLCFFSLLLLFTLVSVYFSYFRVFVLYFLCLVPSPPEMTRVVFSGGLDTTGIICFSGDSRSTSRPSVSSPRCRLYTGSLLVSYRSVSLVSINVTQRLSTEDFRRISSSLPPQVLLPHLATDVRTSTVRGAPHLTRRSDLEASWFLWTSSPRFTTTTSIPTRSCFEILYCRYGEVRRADDLSAPSPIDGVVSLVDSGENTLALSEAPRFITGHCPFNSGKNSKLSSLPIKPSFSSNPRMLILWAWPLWQRCKGFPVGSPGPFSYA
ncbi:unnamed protein product [Eruca vesicaria subsp. sativa]|uniref:Uncharacterized protein n=1 Tax=Eruca vesicaria subsp. sativa TaxID=29727 RepID=A0ABC8KN48_ERUVS|nr:unnamed protein product [Eruca vesicaria subsp. sativa]